MSAVLANTALDDPLENAEQLADQMDSLPFIFRFEYEEMNQYFCSVMDPIVAAYSRGLAPGAAGSLCMLCLKPQQRAAPNTLHALVNEHQYPCCVSTHDSSVQLLVHCKHL